MVVQEAEVRAALGLVPTITDVQQARLMIAVASGHAAVRKCIGYNPEQKAYTNQYFPRAEPSGLELWDGVWDRSGSLAVLESRSGGNRYIQLESLPLRSVSDVRVNPAARYGQQSGDFADDTAWTVGSQWFVEWDEDYVCRTGQLIAVSAWPLEPGTVRVGSYRAGYSPTEFDGPAATTSTDDNGYITVAGVDASPLKAACLLECMRAYHTFATFSQSSLTGMLIPGPKQSETLGQYSYSLASGAAAALLTSMAAEISPQAAGFCEPFVNYGRHLL